MKPHVKIGLIVGGVGLVFAVPISAFLGVCGPIVALVAGIVAALLSSSEARKAHSSEVTRVGTLSALIAGSLVMVGQLIGGLAVLALAYVGQVNALIGTVPTASSTSAEKGLYLAGGLGVGVCFGTVGIVLAVLGGLLAAYLASSSRHTLPPQP